ncbi:MAG: deoxyguanosinetriphosphate triphosphohydrolase [Victivallales bacterium]|nr:deoxyguanosinetriphosphate triphosphohydrolase [Victivallales bacterium]
MPPMEWKQLLSHKRLGKDQCPELVRGRSPFQQDYDRIIFSSAFRRLQDKTQVFPLAENDYIRTRLTHSLEASCVGRSLGSLAGVHLCANYDLGALEPADVGAIVAAASLAHDIGNPPLGHSGEEAIRHWFMNSPIAAAFKDKLSHAEKADIEQYEGNAQGFRVLTRLQMPDNKGGMQLSCATLGAFVKYPGESTAVGIPDAFSKKFNFFQHDKAAFEEVADVTGLIKLDAANDIWLRHPLAFLVEAADDVCYTIIDFEDGHQLGLISYDELERAYTDITGPLKRELEMQENQRKAEFLRAMALNTLIEQLNECFIANESKMLTGEFTRSLTDEIPAAAALKYIIKRSREDVYSYRRAIEIEVAGYEFTTGLLDVFSAAVNDIAENGENKASYKSRKIFALLPEQFRGKGDDAHEWKSSYYVRLLNVLDFICGMTDSYAVSLYKKIKGISLPGMP